MADCIKSEDVIAELNKRSQYVCDNDFGVIIRAENVINAIPAANVVEVVRCKDCVHYDKGKNDSESWEYCKVLAKDVYDDFYCKFGERRGV